MFYFPSLLLPIWTSFNFVSPHIFQVPTSFPFTSFPTVFPLKSRHERNEGKKKFNVFVAAREFYDLNSFSFCSINLEIPGNSLGTISLQSFAT